MQINFVIERLCSYYQLDKKKDLADKLGVKPSVISNWITRNTIDWSIIFTKCEDINLNWVVYGQGHMKRLSNSENPAYKDLFEKQKEEIKELNREIGKLQLTIENLQNVNRTANLSIAAEPKSKYEGK